MATPSSVIGYYRLYRRAERDEWASFEMSLDLKADGSVSCGMSGVADRDTSYSDRYEGKWELQGNIIHYKVLCNADQIYLFTLF